MESPFTNKSGLKAKKLMMGSFRRSVQPSTPEPANNFQSFFEIAQKIGEINSKAPSNQEATEKSEITFSNVNFPKYSTTPPRFSEPPLSGFNEMKSLLSGYVSYQLNPSSDHWEPQKPLGSLEAKNFSIGQISPEMDYQNAPINFQATGNWQNISVPFKGSGILAGTQASGSGILAGTQASGNLELGTGQRADLPVQSQEFKTYDQLEKELKGKEAVIENMNKDLELRNTTIFELHKQIEELKKKEQMLSDAEKMMVFLKNTVEKLQKEKEGVKMVKEHEIEFVKGENQKSIELVQKEKKQIETEKQVLVERNERTQAELRKTQEDLQKLSREIEILGFEKDQSARDKERAIREKQICEMELNALKDRRSSEENAPSNLGLARVGLLEAKITSLEGELRRKDKMISEMQEEKIRSFETPSLETKGTNGDKETEKLREELRSSQERVNRLMNELRNKENEMFKFRKEKVDYEESVEGKLATFEQVSSENGRLMKVIKQMQEAMRKQESIIEEAGSLEQKWTSDLVQKEEQAKRIRLLEEDNEKLGLELDSLEERLVTNQELMKQKMIEATSLTRERDDAREALERITVRYESMEKLNKVLKEKIMGLENQEARFLSNEELFEHDLKSTVGRCRELEDQVRIWKGKVEEAESELAEKREIEMKLSSLAEENMRLREGLKITTEKLAMFQNQIEGKAFVENAAAEMKKKLFEQHEDILALSQDREELVQRVKEGDMIAQENAEAFKEKVNELQRKLIETRTEKQHLEMQLQKAKGNENELAQTRFEHEEQRKIIKELEGKLEILSKELLAQNRTIDQSENEVRSYQEVIEDLEKENGMLRHEINRLSGEAQVREGHFQKKHDEMAREQADLEEKTSIILQENDFLERTVGEMKKEKQKLVQYTNECQKYMNECEESLEEFRNKHEELIRNIEILSDENMRLKEAINRQKRSMIS